MGWKKISKAYQVYSIGRIGSRRDREGFTSFEIKCHLLGTLHRNDGLRTSLRRCFAVTPIYMVDLEISCHKNPTASTLD